MANQKIFKFDDLEKRDLIVDKLRQQIEDLDSVKRFSTLSQDDIYNTVLGLTKGCKTTRSILLNYGLLDIPFKRRGTIAETTLVATYLRDKYGIHLHKSGECKFLDLVDNKRVL